MGEPTDIEKKSLEAHVELCAERYKSLDSRLDDMHGKIGKVEEIVEEVYDMLHSIKEQRNTQLINWGIGIIGTLTAIIGFLLSHFIG